MSAQFMRWASRSSFIRGLAYLFAPPKPTAKRRAAARKTDQQIDDEAIASDWLAIGDDLRAAIAAEREHIEAHQRARRRELVDAGV